VIIGDARIGEGQALGGNDVIPGRIVYGDFTEMSGDARGGNDRVTASSATDYAYGLDTLAAGDAGGFMTDRAVGGNDTLIGSQLDDFLD
jgi:hypothetical protein